MITISISILLALFMVWSNNMQGKDLPLIETIKVDKNKISIVPHKSFASYFKDPEFIVCYEEDIDLSVLDESVTSIPFIMCYAPLVWVSGKRYTLNCMDNDLYRSLQKIKLIFKLFFPFIDWSGELLPEKLVYTRPVQRSGPDRIALLYSGGLDSTCMSFSHRHQKQLLITLCGIDIPFTQREQWSIIKASCFDFARRYKHDNAFIRSNAVSCIDYSYLSNLPGNLTKWWWWDHILPSLGFVALTAPLLVYKGYNSLLFASSNTIDFPYPLANHPLVDNNISFAGIRVHHEQGDLTRLDKLTFISSSAKKERLKIPRLRVCWSDPQGGNCGNCEKCLRTINAIIANQQDIREFGFDVSVAEAIKRTKDFIATKLALCNSGIIWEWKNIQDFMRKRLSLQHSEITYIPIVRGYAEWLTSLSFDYSKEDTITRDKQFFTQLWLLGQMGPTDLSKLQAIKR